MPADVYDARIMGADAVLLIVGRSSSDDELAELSGLAAELGMAALVEVHDEGELERALAVGAGLIGVNQRDLHTFEVDRERAARVAGQIPPGVVKIAESGIELGRRRGRARARQASTPSSSASRCCARRDRSGRRRGASGTGRAMWVKICGITSEEDALLAVAMGADAVGFVFAPSPRQMSPNAVAAITRRLPPEICTVGVFRDEEPRRVVEIVNRAGLDAAQLHGRESFEDCGYVSVRVPIVIKAFSAGDDRLARAAEYGADIVLVDAPSPGSGKVFDWRLAEGAPKGRRLVLAGGLNPDNVADAIRTVHPWGVDVSTGVEATVGQEGRPARCAPSCRRPARPSPRPTTATTRAPTTGRRTH